MGDESVAGSPEPVAARRGRWTRGATVTAALSVAVVLAGAAGLWASLGPAGEEDPGPGPAGPPPAPFAGCGAPPPTGPGTGPLRLAADLPARAGAGSARLTGTVTVTNRGATAVAGTTGPEPELWVVRDGRVVAVPAPSRAVAVTVELPPGATGTLPATVDLTPCVPGATGPLPAADYQLYAVVRIDPAGGPAAGTAVVGVGGPWPLRLG